MTTQTKTCANPQCALQIADLVSQLETARLRQRLALVQRYNKWLLIEVEALRVEVAALKGGAG